MTGIAFETAVRMIEAEATRLGAGLGIPLMKEPGGTSSY